MRMRKTVLVPMLVAVATFLCHGCKNDEDEALSCTDDIPERVFEDVQDTTFPIGPMIFYTTSAETRIMWQTESECEGEVLYGVSGGELDRSAASERNGLIHKARIEGLEPDTRYDYQVQACGLATSVLSFWTAPASIMPVRFTVLGDSQSYPERARATVVAMAARHPYFTLHVGDVLGDGNEHSQWKDEFFDPFRFMGHFVPTFVAMGNHEDNSDYFYDYVDYPYPSTLLNHNIYGSNYSFSYGNVFVLVLDTNSVLFLTAAAGVESEVSRWIEERLASEEAQNATWRIATGHHSGFSESWSPGGCDGYDGTKAVKEWLMPLMAQHGFHAYFCGHTHAYERGEDNGIVHIITGGGGGSLDEWCRDWPETEVVESSHHFLYVEAGCEEMTITAYRVPEGTIIDTVVIHR